MNDPAPRPPEEGGSSRREFVDLMLIGALGVTAIAALIPAAAYVVPPEGGEAQTDEAVLPFSAEELAVNTGRIFKFGNQPGIAIKTASGDVRAFSAKCTHLSCIVQYVPASSRINCNCHGGWYDLTGKNVGGPPPRPLTAYVVNLRRRQGGAGHDIVVSRA